MHVFKIAKFDSTDEIQGLIGRGCQQYNVMKKVACFAKFNTLAESWSEPVFLLINLPATDSLPSGTDKHHLMKTSTRKGKIIIETKEELELKIKGLKATIDKCRDHQTFDDEDGKWWDDFWEPRSVLPEGNQGTVASPPDPVILAKVKRLLWEQTDLVQRPPTDRELHRVEVEAQHRDLGNTIIPTRATAGTDVFGRNRDVGYLMVSVGEARTAEARTEAYESTVATKLEKQRVQFFEKLQLSRGRDEMHMAEKVKVRKCVIRTMMTKTVFYTYYDI